MGIVRFAFYRPSSLGKDPWGNAIGYYTGFFNAVGSLFTGKGWRFKNYCHVEIGIFIDNKWNWYSSASRNADGTNGTRWIDEKTLFKNPDRWDVYEVTAKRSTEEMVETCKAELGKKYDWSGIFGFVTIFGLINEKDKWYCSEICNYIYTGKWINRISPDALYFELEITT